MAEYYYFAAQLPLLRFGEKSFFSPESFMAEAGKWFCRNDRAVLERTDLNAFPPAGKDAGVLRRYKEFESAFREGIALYRDARGNHRGHKLPEDLSGALSQGNPLEKETALLKIRWDFVDELSEGHYFDLAFFITYFLKLQILERLEIFNKEHGKEKFTQICEVTL